MFESLDRTLLELGSFGELWFRPNAGNAGDALIASATWQRFRRLGLVVRPIPFDGFSAQGKIVLYGGGGNLVPMYRQASDFMAANHRTAKRFVLLPHTVDGHLGLLGTLGPNCILFCREKVSYAHCLRAAAHASVEVSHDLALGLDLDAFPPTSPAAWTTQILHAFRVTLSRGGIPGAGLSELGRILTFAGRQIPVHARRGKVLDAFREDLESGRQTLPEGNLDLSQILSLKDVSERGMGISSDLLLGALRGWRLVRTDRLHVCIAASLVGVRVEFHPNSYFKCAAIWEHSLRGRFPSIRWIS